MGDPHGRGWVGEKQLCSSSSARRTLMIHGSIGRKKQQCSSRSASRTLMAVDGLEQRSNYAASVLHQGPSWPWMGWRKEAIMQQLLCTNDPHNPWIDWRKEATMQQLFCIKDPHGRGWVGEKKLCSSSSARRTLMIHGSIGGKKQQCSSRSASR